MADTITRSFVYAIGFIVAATAATLIFGENDPWLYTVVILAFVWTTEILFAVLSYVLGEDIRKSR